MIEMALSDVLSGWRPGSMGNEWTWQQEHDDVWFHPGMARHTDVLATSIQENGIREPVVLGTDGRVWDGHHRIVIAMRLGIEKVPVVMADETYLADAEDQLESASARLDTEGG